LNPWDDQSRFNLGLFHLSRGEPDRAAEPLLQAWTLDRSQEKYAGAARRALEDWRRRGGGPALGDLLARYGSP